MALNDVFIFALSLYGLLHRGTLQKRRRSDLTVSEGSPDAKGLDTLVG